MYVLDARFHEVNTPFDHPECELNLTRGFICILPTRNHVEPRSALSIVAEYNFFSCNSLKWRDPFWHLYMIMLTTYLWFNMLCTDNITINSEFPSPFEVFSSRVIATSCFHLEARKNLQIKESDKSVYFIHCLHTGEYILEIARTSLDLEARLSFLHLATYRRNFRKQNVLVLLHTSIVLRY